MGLRAFLVIRRKRREIKVGICGWNPQSRDIIGQLQPPDISRKYEFSLKIICPPRTRRKRSGCVNWQEYELNKGDYLVVMAYELPDW